MATRRPAGHGPARLAGLPARQRDGRFAPPSPRSSAWPASTAATRSRSRIWTSPVPAGRDASVAAPPITRQEGTGFPRGGVRPPTGKFRDRLAQMTANAGLAVIAADPAYTSRWGAEHWLAPLRRQASPIPASGHHAAAVVIGRRALGYRARRREGVTGADQRISRRGAAPRAPAAQRTDRDGRARQAPRQPPQRRRKTAMAQRPPPPDQAAQDRSGRWPAWTISC